MAHQAPQGRPYTSGQMAASHLSGLLVMLLECGDWTEADTSVSQGS